jgi:hypothetical protein
MASFFPFLSGEPGTVLYVIFAAKTTCSTTSHKIFVQKNFLRDEKIRIILEKFRKKFSSVKNYRITSTAAHE